MQRSYREIGTFLSSGLAHCSRRSLRPMAAGSIGRRIFRRHRGFPATPSTTQNPFALTHYFARAVSLLRTLLLGLETFRASGASSVDADPHGRRHSRGQCDRHRRQDHRPVARRRAGIGCDRGRSAGPGRGRAQLNAQSSGKHAAAGAGGNCVRTSQAIRSRSSRATITSRHQWEIIDLVLANLVGAVRYKLLTDPRGLDAINHLDHREWLRVNGASERAINSPFTRALYDLTIAYEGGDPDRPAMAAGAALRGALRFFFCYRGALFWKMRAGMGDVVFAPFYEALRAARSHLQILPPASKCQTGRSAPACAGREAIC